MIAAILHSSIPSIACIGTAIMAALEIPLAIHARQLEQAVLAAPPPTCYTRASLPVPNATKSFWIHNLDAGQSPSLIEGSEGGLTSDADVCIIGSGITGVSAAYHLANLFATHESEEVEKAEKAKVVVLEAREFC